MTSSVRVIIPQTELPENYTAIVTGAHAGLGYEVAKYLALLGARVILACDNEVRARAAVLRIQADVMEIRGVTSLDDAHEEDKEMSDIHDIGPSPSERGTIIDHPLQLEVMKLNLDSMKSVQKFVEQFQAMEYPLHLLICNDAVINVPQETTEDGFERHFQHNYLSNFLLCVHLLPMLKQHREDARIILVTSTNHSNGEFNMKNIQNRNNYNRSKACANSQLYSIMLMQSLHRRLEGSNVSTFAVHNGAVDTLLKKEDDPATWGTLYTVGRTIGKILKNTSKSVNNCLNVALSPGLKDLKGHFFAGGIPVTPSPAAKDIKAQEVFWRYSVGCLKDYITQSDIEDLRLSEDSMKNMGIIE